MSEECGVSRFADFDKAAIDNSYVTNCLFIQRADQQGVMFDTATTPGKVCARLDKYAIIPIEEYERLSGLPEGDL